ncbi:MAG TPA: NAD(P)-dependent oxidoreductase, partial [Gammaproteobacteria bacterium]|nr:NAD(P)-dependent oxidoreductase [Gammaproteobacteria bacterium]
TFVSEPDYLVLTLPATDSTYHLVDRETLDAMRGDARLINVGRGSLVDEPALVDGLRKGAIAGAVLDVFEEEPLPESSPLWELSNCHVTPHVAADSFPEDIAGIFAENYRRYVAGRELLYRVDFERGY